MLTAAAIMFIRTSADAFTVEVRLEPIDSRIVVNGKPLAKPQTKAGILKLSLDDKIKANQVRFERAGYEPRTVTFSRADSKNKTLAVELAQLVSERITINSVPSGASLFRIVGDRTEHLGTTPVTAEVTYRKPGRSLPWEAQTFRLELADHESENVVLTQPGRTDLTQALVRLHEIVSVPVSSSNEYGEPVWIRVARNGTPIGEGETVSVPMVFSRPTKDAPWPAHTISVEDPFGVLQPATASITYDRRGQALTLTLKPAKEALLVQRNFPFVEVASSGCSLAFDASHSVAMIDTEEPSPAVTNVERISNFGQREPGQPNPGSLNSYCITPDGKHAILAITQRDKSASVLVVKRAEKDARDPYPLFEQSGAIDTAPTIAPDGEDLLIFQSNRADRAKPDLFSVRLRKGDQGYRPSGGIARITNDQWINFAPGFASFTSQEIAYLSIDPFAPTRPAIVKSVQYDGRLVTEFPFHALSVAQPDRARVLIVGPSADGGRLEIRSADMSTGESTPLVLDPSFAAADCFAPAASPDRARSRILFVSNRDTSAKGRPQHDIYVMEADGSGVVRLTENESDDIMPSWSPRPDEPDTVYFMSNRGGAYNLWRMRIAAGR